jgi:hypothetical protein
MTADEEDVMAAIKAGGDPTGKLKELLVRRSAESIRSRVPFGGALGSGPKVTYGKTRAMGPTEDGVRHRFKPVKRFPIWVSLGEYDSADGYSAYSPQVNPVIGPSILDGDGNPSTTPSYTTKVVPSKGEFSLAAMVVSPDSYATSGYYTPMETFNSSYSYTDVQASMLVAFVLPEDIVRDFTSVVAEITVTANNVAPIGATGRNPGGLAAAVDGYLGVAIWPGFSGPAAAWRTQQSFFSISDDFLSNDVSLPVSLSVQMPYDGKTVLFAVEASIEVVCSVQADGIGEIALCDFRLPEPELEIVTDTPLVLGDSPDGRKIIGPLTCPFRVSNISLSGVRDIGPRK